MSDGAGACGAEEDAGWDDLQPEPVTEDQGKVVAIQYAPEHRQALGYFRAALKKGEKSPRLLRLTQQLIDFNSADYTAWQVRWDVLRALGSDLRQEYQLTGSIARSNAKNYQLWNHRRKLAMALGPECAAEEFAFAAEALTQDSKNYHAWAHRQHLVAHWGAWEEEWQYVSLLIQQDVRNNSAWNQRAFLLQNDPAQLPRQPLGVLLDRELEYVAEQLALAPRNDSPWNYLWGLFALPGCRAWEMGRRIEVHIICKEALGDCPSCVPALDTLAQYYLCLASLAADAAAAEQRRRPHSQQPEQQQAPGEQGQLLTQREQRGADPPAPGAPPQRAGPGAAAAAAGHAALEVLQRLLVADALRVGYWRHRMQRVRDVMAQAGWVA